MKRVIATLLAFAMTASTHATADATAGATANATAGAEAQLRAQLAAFVEGAAASDAAVHDAFWAEELVYTSSSGTRFGKAKLMAGVHASGPADPADVEASYGARDVIVRLVGELGLLDFTLGCIRSRRRRAAIPEQRHIRVARRPLAGRELAGDEGGGCGLGDHCITAAECAVAGAPRCYEVRSAPCETLSIDRLNQSRESREHGYEIYRSR